uniref:SPOR domain-containing protein n=1 Tax=Haemonchus contortus TaxID=6289 RepID=A0A7I5E9T9_HAECO
MLRLLFLLTMVGFVAGCRPSFMNVIRNFFFPSPPPPAPTKSPETVTAESTIVYYKPWNSTETQSLKDKYEKTLTPKLEPLGTVKNVQAKDEDRHFALVYTITRTDCSKVKSTLKKYKEENSRTVWKTSTKCS